MRIVRFTEEVAGEMYELKAAICDKRHPPLVMPPSVANKLPLWPRDHLKVATPLDSFIQLYAAHHGITREEAAQEIQDTAFLTALEEIEEDEDESA